MTNGKYIARNNLIRKEYNYLRFFENPKEIWGFFSLEKRKKEIQQRNGRTLLLILNGVCSDQPGVAQKHSIQSDIL